MKTFWIDKIITYDGTQLRSHWIYEQTGILGSVAVAFAGPADVSISNMVDLVDVRENAPIFSRNMLHIIIEHFDRNLPLTIARQRLLVSIAADLLRNTQDNIERHGDDIMCGDLKLSVSIATLSPLSALIHFAINIESEGTPVPTLGLADLKVDPKEFGSALLKHYSREISSMEEAMCKVRAVK